MYLPVILSVPLPMKRVVAHAALLSEMLVPLILIAVPIIAMRGVFALPLLLVLLLEILVSLTLIVAGGWSAMRC